MPARRSTRANATAIRSGGRCRAARQAPRAIAGDQIGEPVRADALLVLAVLENRAERRVDRRLVEPRATERRERLRPVDRLGDARRLVEVERAQRFGRGRDIARQRVGYLAARARARSRARVRSRDARSSGTGTGASTRRARRGCGSTSARRSAERSARTTPNSGTVIDQSDRISSRNASNSSSARSTSSISSTGGTSPS